MSDDRIDPGPWIGKACYYHPSATTEMVVHAWADRAIVSLVCGESLDALKIEKGHAWLQALPRLELEAMLVGGNWQLKPDKEA